MNIVETVRTHVLKRYSERDDAQGMDMYDTHVKYVVEYAKELAKKLNANEEVVEIAALMHDIARVDWSNETHHIDGANYAEKYLTKLGYDSKKIAMVKHCIIAHRGSQSIPRETIEAECVASADAMAHFRSIPDMIYYVYVDLGKELEEGKTMLKDKFERSFRKMIPEAQEIVREKYEAAMVILS
ncbi:HD domain-containing protein [Patescibacteria group bacterium]|nr:HD domain-containing protein [Patescibacteria group bacterium]